ncbi:MAG: hypothetical protein ABI656_07705 [bacterium]
MIRLFLVSLSTLAALSLVACGERDQLINGSTVKSDGKPWQGAKNDFVVRGWTPGDKESWEKQIRTRTQNQNEYVRIN